MSYQVPEPTPTRQRPATVTLAGCGQFAILALAVLSSIASFALIGRITSAVDERISGEDLGRGVDPQTLIGVMRAVLVLGIVLGLVIPILLAVFGAVHMRGKNWARVTTWVLAGIGICCGLFGLAGIGGTADLTMKTQTNGNDELANAIQDAIASVDIPGWIQPVQAVSAVLTLLLYIAVVVLLALPASNEFFRKLPPEPHGLPPIRLPVGTGKLYS